MKKSPPGVGAPERGKGQMLYGLSALLSYSMKGEVSSETGKWDGKHC